MKRIFLFLLINVLFIGVSQAQIAKFGIKGGFNLSDAKVSRVDTKVLPSVYIGGVVEFNIPKNERIKIQAELLYERNGTIMENWAYLEGYNPFYFDDKVIIHDLSVPVMVKYFVLDKLAIEGGTYFSFLLSAKEKALGETFSATDALKTVDFGLLLGAEYTVYSNLFVELRYNFGLVDRIDNSYPKLHSRNGHIGIGYKFPSKKAVMQ